MTENSPCNAPWTNGVTLALITAVALGLCQFMATQLDTAIQNNHHNAKQAVIKEITQNRQLAVREFHPNLVQLAPSKSPFFAWAPKAPVYQQDDTLIFTIDALKGYGGPIRLILGVTSQEALTGVRMIPPHFETPGLGDKIDTRKSNWMLQFNGLSLHSPISWTVSSRASPKTNTFDAFTGATITPRAVVSAIEAFLKHYQHHRETLWRPLSSTAQ